MLLDPRLWEQGQWLSTVIICPLLSCIAAVVWVSASWTQPPFMICRKYWGRELLLGLYLMVCSERRQAVQGSCCPDSFLLLWRAPTWGNQHSSAKLGKIFQLNFFFRKKKKGDSATPKHFVNRYLLYLMLSAIFF